MKPFDLSQGLPPLDEVLKQFNEPSQQNKIALPSVDWTEQVALISSNAQVTRALYQLNKRANPYEANMGQYCKEEQFRDRMLPLILQINKEHPRIEIATCVPVYPAWNDTQQYERGFQKFLPDLVNKTIIPIILSGPHVSVSDKQLIDRSCAFRHY